MSRAGELAVGTEVPFTLELERLLDRSLLEARLDAGALDEGQRLMVDRKSPAAPGLATANRRSYRRICAGSECSAVTQ